MSPTERVALATECRHLGHLISAALYHGATLDEKTMSRIGFRLVEAADELDPKPRDLPENCVPFLVR